MKYLICACCNHKITYNEYMNGFCTASKNSYHQAVLPAAMVKKQDCHLGAVGE